MAKSEHADPADVRPESDRPGWRRSETATPADVQRRWQSGTLEQPQRESTGGRRWPYVLSGLLIAGCLALLAVYVRSILLDPVRTPMLVVAAGPYGEPFGPNAWAADDIDGLADLDGETLTLVREPGLQNLDRQLTALADEKHSRQTLIIYISMHGAVDEAGQPCLIPPEASAWDTRTWIPVRSIIERIRQADLPAGIHKLVILDCQRERANWRRGLLDNTFADRLAEADWLKQDAVPNLVILCAAGPGQQGWAAPELRGTVFGHYLRQGLSGAADAGAEGGNGDRRVSMRELHSYLRHHVDQWVRHHRGDRQQPLLLPANAAAADLSFAVTWSLRGTLPEQPAEPSPVAGAEIERLWARHDKLRDDEPYRFDPLGWRDFQQQLLRLEETAAAGRAYERPASLLAAELTKSVDRLEQQASRIRSERSLYGEWQVFSRMAPPQPQPFNLPTLALAEYFGTIEPPVAERLRSGGERFRQSPSSAALREVTDSLESDPQAALLDETHFLRLLERYDVPALWSDRSVIDRVLALRELAARIAVPRDERVLAGIAADLRAADDVRRNAEDRLFLGEAAGNAVAAVCDDATRQYEQVRARTDSLSQAWRLRDRIWAEGPWLARWLARPATLESPPAFDLAEAKRTLAALLDNAHRLDAALEAGQPFAEHFAKLSEQLEALNRLYDDECNRLLNNAPRDVATLRAVDAALSVPLVPSRQREEFRKVPAPTRQRLRTAAATTSAELVRTYSPVAATNASQTPASETPAGAVPPRSDLPLPFEWDQPLPLAILEGGAATAAGDAEPAAPPVETADAVVRVAAIEARLRQHLRDLPQQVAAAQTREPAESGFRTGWSQAERLVRRAATLAFPPLESDPVEQLRRLDFQQLLLWHAQRVLDDFRGPASAGEPPFFAASARNCLEAASSVFPPNVIFAQQAAPVERLLVVRQEAAERGLSVTADRVLRIDDGQPASTSVAVVSGLDEAVNALPVGIASVFVRDAHSRLEAPAQPLALPLEPAAEGRPTARLSVSLSPAALAGRGPYIEALAMFRGHEFSSPVLVDLAGGATVAGTPSRSRQSRITVTSSGARPASIVFILDCSRSMNEAADTSRSAGGRTRFDAAAGALDAMLSQLAGRGNTRVGVIFYGHRVGWNAENRGELLRQTRYEQAFGQIPPELLPLEDVEAVLKLGRFDDPLARRVSTRLTAVEPWGETPLYLAMLEALRQFTGEDADRDRRIVVITDGRNNQRLPADRPLTEAQQQKIVDGRSVLAAIDRQPIPIHIIGFGIPSSEAASARQEFRAITERSQGSYVAGVAADTLLPQLRMLFGPDRFRAEDSTGNVVASAAPGGAVTVGPVPAGGATFTVVVGSVRERVRLQGGEALVLEADEDAGVLLSHRYVAGDPAFVNLIATDSNAANSMLAGFHRPERTGPERQHVEFSISFQREDDRVASRPQDVWLEITPRGADGRAAGPSYFWYDAWCVANRPVPVVSCTALDWPAGAPQAAVRLWCRFADPAAGTTVPLAALRDLGRAADDASQLPGGVAVQGRLRNDNGQSRLTLIESHPAGGGRFEPLQLMVAAADGLPLVPLEAQRRFDPTHRLAVHDLTFDQADASRLDSAVVRVTAPEALRSSAWRVRENVTLDVPDASAVIRLQAP